MPQKTTTKTAQTTKQASPVKKLCLVLAIITFIFYANTLQNGYVLDDVTVTIKNSIVTKGLAGIPELLTTPRLKGYEGANDQESYRPVPLILSAIEYQIFGPNAAEGHLSNILLFIGCVIALFVFLYKLFGPGKTGVAFVTALLFALHPIHTEVVANIKSRDELMCFLFAFLALSVYINYARQGKPAQLLAGAILLLLSFGSKETVISFVFVIPLVFFFYANDDKRRSLFITTATVLVTAGFMATRAAVLGAHHTNTINFIANPLIYAPDAASRMATGIMVLGMYLKLLFIPYPLVCDYGYNSIPLAGFDNVWVICSLAIYLLLLATGIYRLIKKPKDTLAFAILFFLGTIALFSNIPFLIYSELAERFLFFASAGFCLAIAIGCERWLAGQEIQGMQVVKDKRAYAVLIPVCLIFCALTIMRNADWKDNHTLFRTDLAKAENDCELNFYMGTEISQNRYAEETNPQTKKELLEESIGYLNHAVAIYPDFSEAHAELGRIYENLQVFDSAIRHDLRAIALNPGNSIATYNLARAYYFQKQYPDAIEAFKKTIALQPGLVMVYLNLARCYSDNNQYDSAIIYFNQTLAIDANQQLARQGLAFAYAMKSKTDTTGKK